MPVTIDLMANKVIRDFFLQGKQEGKQEGAKDLLSLLGIPLWTSSRRGN
jgi:hypothetical protein